MTGALDAALAAVLVWLAWRCMASTDLFRVVVLFIAFGLVLALAWVRLDAPDIALAEAAIGAGLTGALLLDAVSFLLSALLIQRGVRHRPAVERTSRPTLKGDIVEGARVVFHDAVLRSILLLAWAGAAFAMVPEGLAVTYARRLGYGPLATGVLTAAIPAGLVVGALVIGRMMGPRTRVRIMRPLAAVSFVPLVLTAMFAEPNVWTTLLTPRSLGLVLVLASATAAYALEPAGEEFQVNSYTTSIQYGPSVSSDSDGDFALRCNTGLVDLEPLGEEQVAGGQPEEGEAGGQPGKRAGEQVRREEVEIRKAAAQPRRRLRPTVLHSFDSLTMECARNPLHGR